MDLMTDEEEGEPVCFITIVQVKVPCPCGRKHTIHVTSRYADSEVVHCRCGRTLCAFTDDGKLCELVVDDIIAMSKVSGTVGSRVE